MAGVLEEARREKVIGSSLEGAIALTASEDLERDRAATGTEGPGLADLFIVSAVSREARGESRRRLARLRRLSRPVAAVREGRRPPVRPVLEGHPGSR